MPATVVPSLVVFDLDDTLYPYDPAHHAGMGALVAYGVAETRVSETDFRTAYDTGRARVKARLGETGGSHSRLLYIAETLEQLGFGFQPALALALDQEYWRTYILAMRLRPGADTLLALLRYHQVPVCIVTDLTTQIQFRKLIHLKLDSLIDHVVVSDETEGDKVTLAPFRLLKERVRDEHLEHVWFVGDKPHDAPIDALVREGIIRAGHGWVHKGTGDERTSGWTELTQIEQEFERLLDGR